MKIFAIILGLLSLNLNAEQIQGEYCGTRGNLWGTIASDYAIPDYFPPENALLRGLLVNPSFIDLSTCEEDFSRAYLGSSCLVHDQCYGTLGKTKESCDEAILAGWLQACEQSYAGFFGSLCSYACQQVADIMYQAMLYRDGSFCPSCEAYDNAQKAARGSF